MQDCNVKNEPYGPLDMSTETEAGIFGGEFEMDGAEYGAEAANSR